MLIADSLARTGAVRHAFFTRRGGVSQGPYASLNCGLGSDDDPELVRENRSVALGELDAGDVCRLVSVCQVHSADVVQVQGAWPDEARPTADGMVTNVSGLALGILTADCAPVLFADPCAGVIGAAHAGWRGAKGGVVEATVSSMLQLGARRDGIVAAVGPCISQPSYEVGPDFHASFTQDDPATTSFFIHSDRPGHFQFDLQGYVGGRLRAAGIQTLCVLDHDTCADEARFFSFRRTTLNGGGDYGRQLSAIALVRDIRDS